MWGKAVVDKLCDSLIRLQYSMRQYTVNETFLIATIHFTVFRSSEMKGRGRSEMQYDVLRIIA
jgi:hypothetical protein